MTDNDKVPELTNGEFEKYIGKGLVLIDFFADWCMPCLMMSSVIDELSEKFDGKIKFGKVNVDDDPDHAKKFSVNSIPHLVLMKDGEVVETFVGSIAEEELEDKLNSYL